MGRTLSTCTLAVNEEKNILKYYSATGFVLFIVGLNNYLYLFIKYTIYTNSMLDMQDWA